MELVNPIAENYVSKLCSVNDESLYKVYQHTLEKHPHQHMLSSWLQGQFLTFISQLASPKYILEIGTFTGFSAICLAKGLQENGELHTIELREEDANTALTNFSICKVENKITLHLGNAKEIIPNIDRKWDIVFIDADKTSYIDYYELVLPRLNVGGIIIADNVLFHGQVLENQIKGKNAVAINNFNEYVANDVRTEQIILTVRDGLMLIKKK
ncbi:MAG: O-methyltransferase [Chitinophagaceae bacterium]